MKASEVRCESFLDRIYRIKKELENEIVLDVHLQRGAVKRIAFLNADVKRAVEILQNQEEYNQILGK